MVRTMAEPDRLESLVERLERTAAELRAGELSGRSLALVRGPHARVELGSRLGGDAGALVDERGRAVGVEPAGAQLGGRALEAVNEHVESVGLSHGSPHSRARRRAPRPGCR